MGRAVGFAARPARTCSTRGPTNATVAFTGPALAIIGKTVMDSAKFGPENQLTANTNDMSDKAAMTSRVHASAPSRMA